MNYIINTNSTRLNISKYWNTNYIRFIISKKIIYQIQDFIYSFSYSLSSRFKKYLNRHLYGKHGLFLNNVNFNFRGLYLNQCIIDLNFFNLKNFKSIFTYLNRRNNNFSFLAKNNKAYISLRILNNNRFFNPIKKKKNSKLNKKFLKFLNTFLLKKSNFFKMYKKNIRSNYLLWWWLKWNLVNNFKNASNNDLNFIFKQFFKSKKKIIFNLLSKIYFNNIVRYYWKNLLIQSFYNSLVVYFLKVQGFNFIRFNLNVKYLFPLSAEYISFIILKQIKAGAELNEVLSILKRLFNQFHFFLKGFRRIFSGRFTRSARATYEFIYKRQVSLSTHTEPIDYCSNCCNTKNGLVAFKIWLHFVDKPGTNKTINLNVFN